MIYLQYETTNSENLAEFFKKKKWKNVRRYTK